jgi:hypothetical protein
LLPTWPWYTTKHMLFFLIFLLGMMTKMDTIICDALRGLECAPEVDFDNALVPTNTRKDIYTYTVPPNGDLVTRLTVRGSAIRKVCVEMMGAAVYTSTRFHPTDKIAEIPVRINMMRLGYHRTSIQVTGSDVDVTATFTLLSDDTERRRIATSEPLFTTGMTSHI